MKTFSLLAIAMLLPVSAAHAADTTGTTPRFAVNAGYASASQHGDTVVPVTLDNSWPAGTDVENSDDAGAATFGFSWYVRPNVAIELWGAGSADNDVEIDVENGPDVNVASYRTRPLALSVQYHFNGLFSGVGERVTPFVGLGWHRTTVSSVKGEAAGYAGLDIDNGNGLAATLGVDVALGQRWFLRGDVRYLRWDTESRIGNTVLAKADLDTVTYGASLGLRF